jgi:hypothetical protein
MRRQIVTVLALVGGALLAPAIANAQTTLLNTSINIDASTSSGTNYRGTGYYFNNLPLSFVSGNIYDIRTAVATQPAYGVDTYILLVSPAGAVLAQDDDNSLGLGNPYGSYLLYTAAASGTHTLCVSTYSGGSTYAGVPVVVTYTAGTPPTPPTTLAIPANTTVNITGPNTPNPRGTGFFCTNFTVNLVAGGTYDFRTAVATQPAYGIDTYILLLNPSGTVVSQDDDNSLNLGNPYGSQIVYQATTSGAYMLSVSTYSAGATYTGVPLTITVSGLPTPTVGIPNVKLAPPPSVRETGSVFALNLDMNRVPRSPVLDVPSRRNLDAIRFRVG